MPGAVGLPPWAVGRLVGVGPVVPALAVVFGICSGVSVEFATRQKVVGHTTGGCRPNVSLSHHALAASDAGRRCGHAGPISLTLPV